MGSASADLDCRGWCFILERSCACGMTAIRRNPHVDSLLSRRCAAQRNGLRRNKRPLAWVSDGLAVYGEQVSSPIPQQHETRQKGPRPPVHVPVTLIRFVAALSMGQGGAICFARGRSSPAVPGPYGPGVRPTPLWPDANSSSHPSPALRHRSGSRLTRHLCRHDPALKGRPLAQALVPCFHDRERRLAVDIGDEPAVRINPERDIGDGKIAG